MPGSPATCVIELAPGYGQTISAPGVEISRSYLLHSLPPPLVATNRVRVTLNRPSLIDHVAPGDQCHCALRWDNGWHVIAHHPIVCGRTVYEHGAKLSLLRSTALVLGIGGWPIVIRIGETHIPL